MNSRDDGIRGRGDERRREENTPALTRSRESETSIKSAISADSPASAGVQMKAEREGSADVGKGTNRMGLGHLMD